MKALFKEYFGFFFLLSDVYLIHIKQYLKKNKDLKQKYAQGLTMVSHLPPFFKVGEILKYSF